MSLLATHRRTAAVLVGTMLVAWAVTLERMHGMDAGPGTDLGGVGWFLGVWVTMSAAMMLPSAMPAALLVARVSRSLLFVAGYLAAWTAYGLLAYGFFRLVTSFDTAWLAWDANGPYVAGGAIVAAGIYELTPLKRRLLRGCRRPRRAGGDGALWTGLENGVYCVGMALWPSSVPGLTEPDRAPAMHMDM